MTTGEGTRLGDYVLDAEIGRGGMGVVYRARHERLERIVALKVIAPELAHDSDFRGRFERESRLAAAIEHPHAVPVYEAGEDDGALYIASRLVEGTDLRALLSAEDWLEPARAARIVAAVAGALDAAHALGLVHRDVKPANILIGTADGREWPYLTDFGLTKRTGEATDASGLTESGEWIGTLDYSSPEQIKGQSLDARSDVYSLGCVLFEALTGRIPFERPDRVAKLYAHVNDPPPAASELLESPQPRLDEAIERAMAKDPADRFPSAGDLGRAAIAATSGEDVTEPEHTVAQGAAAPGEASTRRLGVASRGSGRRRAAVVVGAAAVAIAIALITWQTAGGDDDPEVTGTFEVGANPVGISVGGGSVWVANEADDNVSRLDAETGETIGDPIPVGDRPTGIRVGPGSVWVANSGGNFVSKIDIERGEVIGAVDVNGRPSGVRVGEGSVWVTKVEGDAVARIDLGSGRVVQTIPVGPSPAGVAVGEGSVWVANSGAGTVTRIAPGKGDVLGPPIDVGARPNGIVTGDGYAWVANALDANVTRIDPAGTPEGTTEVGDRPAQIAVGAGRVWVANQRDGTVSVINSLSGETDGDPLEVGGDPRGISFGEGLVWVANSADGTVSRIEP